MATVSYVPNDPAGDRWTTKAIDGASNYPPGDIAKFDIQPQAVAGKYQPHTPEYQFWQAKLALIGGLRTWRPARWQLPAALVRRPEQVAGPD